MKNNKMKIFIPSISRDQKGFTLIELLVSMALLAVGILGLMKSADSVINYQNRSNELTEATLLTTNRLEEIKRLATNETVGGIYGFDYIVDIGATGFLNGYTGTTTVRNRPAVEVIGNYSRTETLSVFPAFTGDPAIFVDPINTAVPIDMVQAQVTTTWTDRKGISRQVQLASIIHRRDF